MASRPKPTRHLSRAQIERWVRELGPWSHNLNLRGVMTAPEHRLGDYPRDHWRQFAHAVPDELHGKTVLDVGCNAGFYAIEMKRRGADRVVGIDCDEISLAQARFAAKVCGVGIELRNMTVYDVWKMRERFDLVLLLGVLPHLRYPLLALDLLHEHVVRDTFVFESACHDGAAAPAAGDGGPARTAPHPQPGEAQLFFVEGRHAGGAARLWIPNRAGAAALLRAAGFEIVSRPAPEIFLCRRGPRRGPSPSREVLP